MVIVCEKCQARFRLADEKVSEKGVKVRCSKCQHTFIVKRPKAEAEEPLPQPPGREAAKPPPPPSEQPPSPGPEVPTKAPSVDDNALDSAISAALSGIMDEERKDETPAPEEFASGESPLPKPPDSGEGSFSFSQEQFDFAEENGSPTEELGTEKGSEELSSGEGLDVGEEKAEEQAPEFKGIEFDSTEEASPKVDLPPAREEPVFPPEPVEEAPIKKQKLPPPKFLVPSAKLKGRGERSPVLRLLLILLFSGALLYGGFFTWQHREELLGLGDSGSLGREGEKASEGRITTSHTKRYFIPRTIRGQSLFVIEGKVTNNYRSSRSFIRMKGSVYSYKGELMASEEVYAGNKISEKDLRNLSSQQIKEIQNNKFGELGSNMDIRPENIVDFMIVFFDLPEEVAEFEVKVSSSQPASQ